MSPSEFQEYIEQHESIYKAFGDHVCRCIESGLLTSHLEDFDNLVQIPAIPRVKSVSSALAKLIKKPYANPVKQMTDLVGVRFVVLLHSQIDWISQVIESESGWTASRDRDHEAEAAWAPKLFGYQSVHYVVTNLNQLDCEAGTIPSGLACEVQIRTLLQHAYSQVDHDKIYKPKGAVPSKVERQMARCMALIETTDQLFDATVELLADANQVREGVLRDLGHFYYELIGSPPYNTDRAIALLVMEAFGNRISQETLVEIRKRFQPNSRLVDKVRKRVPVFYLFSQPVVLLIYVLVEQDEADTRRHWPLQGALEELDIICSDLGIATHR